MSQYENFAYIYDELMEDVEYEQWLKFIMNEITKNNLKEKSICELGCGTGNMTMLLAKAGYDMIGIDISEDMLMVAREKAVDSDCGILYLQQDMREFELYGTVDTIIATCDSLNYIDKEGVEKVFKLVKNYLNPDGLFIFDLNTGYKFSHIYSGKSFSELGENFAYIWENQYNIIEKINEYYISFFVEDKSGRYERFDEYHQEFVHETSEIRKVASNNNMTILGVYNNYSKEKTTNTTQRITYVLKKGIK